MRRQLTLIGIGTLLFTGITGLAAPPKTAVKPASVDFVRDIRPIFSRSCIPCHGSDDKKRQAGLRLDLRDGAMAKLPSGHFAILPGKPAQSTLLQRLVAPASLRMPPVGSGKKLSAEEITLVQRWVAQGASFANHWAFQKPKHPALPKVQNSAWARNPIDSFILAHLEREKLSPNPSADRYTLIRRVSLDLIGIPPTPQEVTDFIADKSPSAYEKVVDRLLASPRYGEKWARMWLDLARYADSAGYGSDPLRPNLWPWRDWVIRAFNANMPYNQFSVEQLAGDLLPNPTQEQLVATTFHRNTMTNTEGGTDREEFRTAAVKDRTITTMQVWMGLTAGCAQCHSHKFDPITQKEFYSLFAVFNQTADNDQPDESPTMPFYTDEQKRKLETLKEELTQLQVQNDKKAMAEKQKEVDAVHSIALPFMRELPAEKQRKTHLLILSNFLQKGDEVTAGTPSFLPPLPASAPRNRLGLAQWLFSKENPMTARVAVNRLWARLFGRGIVETEEDFGTQGSSPTHPELLDWLATEFMEKGWNMKGLLKTVVLSATYRQSSKVTPLHLQKDSRNFLLARYPRRRLDADGVRDQALSLSGLLSAKLGGASVFPPQPDGMWQAAFNGDRSYPTSVGEDRYRRGLYTFWRRTTPYPSMATFDAPSREVCCIRRQPTNTPLQALVTLNDPVYLELAQAMGRRIVQEGGATTESRVRFALQLTLARPPQEAQVQALMQLYNAELARYRAEPEAANLMAMKSLGAIPSGMDACEQAAWTVVANTLLNLDGVLTVG